MWNVGSSTWVNTLNYTINYDANNNKTLQAYQTWESVAAILG